MEPDLGFEPRAYRLRSDCSTTEPIRQGRKSGRNLRPQTSVFPSMSAILFPRLPSPTGTGPIIPIHLSEPSFSP